MEINLEQESSNDGVLWRRGNLLGEGGYGSVHSATLKKPNSLYPSLMAVKSAELPESASLQKETEIYNTFQNNCPYILQFYGEETTTPTSGFVFYNLLLEYASGGTLDRVIKESDGRGLPELDVRRYARCILKGIDYIHRHGYVHCDLKPENILLVGIENRGDFVPKIADFGVSKKRNLGESCSIFGTTMYLSPEAVVDGVQECESDIWAFGCIVFEMLTGKKIWDSYMYANSEELMVEIGDDESEIPEIPCQVSEDGKDFLRACLVKQPEFRSTAEMLLSHPFLSGFDDIISSEIKDTEEELAVSSKFKDFSQVFPILCKL
ncbi:mitogen-activated protein kinase kinase kinase 20-like [Mercurialis annua]|uniref:mitogen-activated protein kinase kinase kinase 20-like n=1 Tax=Mercurialis annua TaxID=3986 RepID=UPI00215ED1BD|nr:mitogen-activated protein kinase kinase kinase 20-like [Mercurialis annua]